jgi:ATP-dependent exoDNAse (exonuclease V) beta subunit
MSSGASRPTAVPRRGASTASSKKKAGDDDPAAGGLAASRDADVVVTTYWQAKGREWPVVVLPELHSTKASPDYPVGPARLTMRDGPDEPPKVVYTSDIKNTPDDDPFDTEKTDVSEELVRPHRKMAARAENRRLLYVAMTRAEDKVVMAGEFQRYRSQKHDPVRLEHAKRWSSAIYLAGGVVFEDGEPVLDPEGGWGEPEEFDVCVKRPEDVDEFDGLEDRHETSPDPDANELAALADHLRPVDTGSLRRASISATEPPEDGVPEPDEVVKPTAAPKLPANPFDDDGLTGDVFHRGMELWAFDEERPAREVWRQALDEYGVAIDGDRQPYVAYLETLLDRLLAFDDVTDELRDARDRNELYPELPVRFPGDAENDTDRTLYRGLVDLVWRDPEGDLHLLDYKTGHGPRDTAGDITDDNELPAHYAQIENYRRGLEHEVGEVASAGLWFPKAGVLVRW